MSAGRPAERGLYPVRRNGILRSVAEAAPKPSRFLTRRRVFKGLACAAVAGAAGAAWMRFVEPPWLKLSNVRVPLSNGARPMLRVLQLSDFHASPVVPLSLVNSAVELALAQQPDLVCLTGDFITHQFEQFEAYGTILKRLSDAAPTFATFGNHDGGSWAARAYSGARDKTLRQLRNESGWFHAASQARHRVLGHHGGYADTSNVRSMLTAARVEVLHNRSVELTARGRKLTIVGTGDLWAQELKAGEAFAGVKPADDRDIICLSHNPDGKDALKAHPWSLVLCGHTHGGQLEVPFFGTPLAPVHDHRFVRGLHRWNDRWIHITKGVGNLHGLRFNCRPEVSLLELA
ncbi:MAG: phosphodiesterase YaeI [Verrucomicrobia bacterium]|nr:phosphodiesterase YaeI [Verrucomicrobiota bacterium]